MIDSFSISCHLLNMFSFAYKSCQFLVCNSLYIILKLNGEVYSFVEGASLRG